MQEDWDSPEGECALSTRDDMMACANELLLPVDETETMQPGVCDVTKYSLFHSLIGSDGLTDAAALC